MHINSRDLLGALILGALAQLAQSQVTKAGLWEVSSNLGGSAEIDTATAQMQQQMASMPPEQRKQMEVVMARQGVNMSSTPAVASSKMCLTKEMIERSQMPEQTQGDCTSTTSNKTNTSMTFRFTCVSPPSSGEEHYTFMGDSAYSMKMKINSPQQGKPVVTTMDSSGKWLGGGCGSTTPTVMPK